MIKEFTGTGKTIEEAVNAAKAGLGAPITADVKVEIVVYPKKKILGLFGGCDAQVKASYEDTRKEKKQKPKSKKKPADKKDKKKFADKAEKKEPEKKSHTAKKEDEREQLVSGDIDLDFVCNYIKTIVESFNISDAKVTAEIVDNAVEVNLECDDYGIVIGRRGETLDAIQYLTSLAINRKSQKYARVKLNVGDYRAKREETLKALAVKNANYVVRTGRRYTFEPMNPYERKVIHTAVQEVDGAVSRSVGSGMDRKVIIEPEGGVRNGRRNSPRRSAQNTPSTQTDVKREKRVDRADIPKFGKIEVNKD